MLRDYEASRKPNADAIADLALEHFHELRDFVGSSDFLLRNELPPAEIRMAASRLLRERGHSPFPSPRSSSP
jgi:hypothetical protein